MVIQIQCPSCPSSFPVDPDKIPEAGVNARCSSCGQVFRVERPTSIDDLAPDAAPDVAAEPEVEPEPEVEVKVEVKVEVEVEAEPEAEPAVEADMSFEPVSAPEADPEPVADSTVAPEDEITMMADFGAEVQAEPEEPATDSFFSGGAPADTEDASAADADVVGDAAVEEAPAEEEAPPEEEGPAVSGFSFGKRDPRDKAKRLARVLLSDMTMYNADLHESALANGSMKEDFEEKIEKSWKEYVEHVGPEMAEGDGQEFWRAALNDVLAKGEEVF